MGLDFEGTQVFGLKGNQKNNHLFWACLRIRGQDALVGCPFLNNLISYKQIDMRIASGSLGQGSPFALKTEFGLVHGSLPFLGHSKPWAFSGKRAAVRMELETPCPESDPGVHEFVGGPKIDKDYRGPKMGPNKKTRPARNTR